MGTRLYVEFESSDDLCKAILVDAATLGKVVQCLKAYDEDSSEENWKRARTLLKCFPNCQYIQDEKTLCLGKLTPSVWGIVGEDCYCGHTKDGEKIISLVRAQLEGDLPKETIRRIAGLAVQVDWS